MVFSLVDSWGSGIQIGGLERRNENSVVLMSIKNTESHFHHVLLLETSTSVSRLKESGHKAYFLMVQPQKSQIEEDLGWENFYLALENSYQWFIFKIWFLIQIPGPQSKMRKPSWALGNQYFSKHSQFVFNAKAHSPLVWELLQTCLTSHSCQCSIFNTQASLLCILPKKVKLGMR